LYSAILVKPKHLNINLNIKKVPTVIKNIGKTIPNEITTYFLSLVNKTFIGIKQIAHNKILKIVLIIFFFKLV
jgi:hypothetical protein